MERVPLPEKNQFKGATVGDYILEYEKGRGNIGVVYFSYHKDIPQLEAACKLIPAANLDDDWDVELKKAGLLGGVPQFVEYRAHGPVMLQNRPYMYILWQWIDGDNLREYAKQHPELITIPFVENLTDELLKAFIAMRQVNVSHDDLHEGNILIAKDPRLPDPERPVIKITDFGLGGSQTGASLKEDYAQLALVCSNLLETVTRTDLSGEDRFFYDRFVEDFLPKRVLETDPTVGSYVREPRALRELLGEIRAEHDAIRQPGHPQELRNPFDYLRCEQMGDSFELLQSLYARSFPGYDDLLQRTNTVLTGPRGCGKTTIFRNLSLKVQLLARTRTLSSLEGYVGIYYHCNDLFFAFPYLTERISQQQRSAIAHYFNLALLRETLDTLAVAAEVSGEARPGWNIPELEGFIATWFPTYNPPPQGTSVLRHLFSFTERQRHVFRQWLADGAPSPPPSSCLPLDFVDQLSSLLVKIIPWLKGRYLCFFLDDYSRPKLSKPIQTVLNDFILLGYPNCCFKLSTESITTLWPYDSGMKLIEETREYDVIDLGSQFLHAGEAIRKRFLAEVIDNRLRQTPSMHQQYHDVEKLLGPPPYESYNELARQIRASTKRGQRVQYAGFDTLVDLCSGDIAEILRILRDILTGAGGTSAFSEPGKTPVPIDHGIQDRALREAGAYFLHRVGAAAETGEQLRRVAEAFGNLAHWVLCNANSKNVAGKPPKQAFRIEILEPLSFEGAKDPVKARTIYNDLIRYAVFLREVRGKSLRGAVVDRLYLRRILIPTFLLTPSQRDNIGIEVSQFLKLLEDPEAFRITRTKRKRRMVSVDQEELKL